MYLKNNKVLDCNPPSFRWVAFLLLIVSNNLIAGKIKNVKGHWNSVYSVSFNKKSNTYKTVSRIIGKEIYEIKEDSKLLAIYGENNVQIKLYTYDEFFNKIKENIIGINYINRLSQVVDEYIELLKIKLFNLTFSIILLPKGYDLQYESKWLKATNNIEFTFVANIDYSFVDQFELLLIRTLPHELFHFLVLYADIGRMSLLRNETYAHLFGQCVSYELNPVIQDEIKLYFPDYFFKEPEQDFPKVLKKLKKDPFFKKNLFPKSHIGQSLARYYFQAVADERNGDRISSEKIPKFCRKLFSEHDFKHPIEKKPPPWFKEFLETE